MKEHIEKCADAAAQHIHSLLEEEQEPFTMNETYFMEYRSKFLAHYKGARLKAKSQFKRNLDNRGDKNVMGALTDTKTSLTRLGLEAVDASAFKKKRKKERKKEKALTKLLLSDPMDPAIEIMADVRAYFQGS
jgi:hypothetical protein